MEYGAIIFDLDGTLLDSLEDLGNAANRVLKKMGFHGHEIDAYRHFIGDGAPMLVRRALPEAHRKDHIVNACLEVFLEDYKRNWMVMTKPYEGVQEMLDALRERGLKMAVLSNKPDRFTKRCVADLLPKWTFDEVLGQRDDVPLKPDPGGAIWLAQKLHVPPKQFLYLGDSAVDMQTALGAGMFPVGALWGFRSPEELQDSGAKALIHDPLEILHVLNAVSGPTK